MSNPLIDVKDEDSSVDLYDEVLIRDIERQMSPTVTTEEDSYDSKTPPFQESPSQSSPEKVDGNDRKNIHQFFVGNLTWWTTDEDIASLVVPLGVNDLLDIRIFDKRTNGQSKGFSLVAVGSERSFRTCMQKLPGQMLNGNPLVTAPHTKQWFSHFEAVASSQTPANQFKNQKFETMPPSQNVTNPHFPVETENRGVRPILPQPKPGFPPNNLGPLHCQQLPPRMPLWPPNNRPGPLCNPSSIPSRRPPMLLPNANNACGPHPPGPPMGPVGPNQWSFPPKLGPGPQKQQPLPCNNWPRVPSPHHNVYQHPGRYPPTCLTPLFQSMPSFHPQGQSQGPPMFPPQPQPHLVPPNHAPAPLYGRQPPFNRVPTSTIHPPVIQTLPSKKPMEGMEDETTERNRAVSSKAFSKAMNDVGCGSFAAAVETLTTAIDIIEQSKMSGDDRSRTLVVTLNDMLGAVVKTARRMDSSKRSNESQGVSPSSHAGASRRSRNRSRSTSRSRGSRSRSRSRERAHHRERSHRGKDESRCYSRDRERRDRASTTSRRRSDRSSSRTRYVTSRGERDREREHESRHSYDRDPASSGKSKNPSPSLTPDRVKDWGHRRRDP